MARYRREGNALTTFIVVVVCAVVAVCCVLVGIHWDTVKGWFKSDESPKVERPNDDEDKDGAFEDGSGNADEFEDKNGFMFDRASLRYNSANVESGVINQVSYEWKVPYDLGVEVCTNDNKVFGAKRFTLADYETYMKAGYAPEEIIEELYETGAFTLTFGASSEWTPEFSKDNYGDRCTMRSSATIKYDELNTRYVVLAFVATKDGENVSFECADFGDKEYTDVLVSPSLVYMASLYDNQLSFGVLPSNPQMRTCIKEVVAKGVAQAKGVAEADYESGKYALEVKTTGEFKVKVGETKKFDGFTISPEIVVDINYMGNSTDEFMQLDCYDITPEGYITGIKAGTYKIVLCIAGNWYHTTFDVIE